MSSPRPCVGVPQRSTGPPSYGEFRWFESNCRYHSFDVVSKSSISYCMKLSNYTESAHVGLWVIRHEGTHRAHGFRRPIEPYDKVCYYYVDRLKKPMEFWIDAGIGKQLRLESGWLVERPHARSERALSAMNSVISNNKRMSHCRPLLNGGKTQIGVSQILHTIPYGDVSESGLSYRPRKSTGYKSSHRFESCRLRQYVNLINACLAERLCSRFLLCGTWVQLPRQVPLHLAGNVQGQTKLRA